MTATTQKSATARYRARVEAHLPTLASDADRLAFLKTEHAKWTDRFENFQRAVALDEYEGDAAAFDFHITMADLAILQSRYIGTPVVSRLALVAAE